MPKGTAGAEVSCNEPWVHDIVVESDVQRGNPIGTTGGHVWEAAHRLVEFLEASQEELNLRRRGLRVLELGAGCGWLGMTVARNLPDAEVCVTEMAFGGALEHLEHNVELNRAKLAAPLSQLTAADCDWSLWTQSAAGDGGGGEGGAAQAEDPSAAGWDLVIGSDLVYNDAGIKSLPLVLAGLLRRRGCALYAHTLHRFEMADQDFFAHLAAAGLEATEVREPGVPPPPASPPPFETLFPEMRIAVFRIVERAGAPSAR